MSSIVSEAEPISNPRPVPLSVVRETEAARVESAPAAPNKAKPKLATYVLSGLVAVALGGGSIAYASGQNKESTDDAQVEGRVASVAARVAGQVKRVLVRDNQFVKA